jgi:hypothetical protein
MGPSAKSGWSNPEEPGVFKPRARRTKPGPTTTNPLCPTWSSFTRFFRENTSDGVRRTRTSCGLNARLRVSETGGEPDHDKSCSGSTGTVVLTLDSDLIRWRHGSVVKSAHTKSSSTSMRTNTSNLGGEDKSSWPLRPCCELDSLCDT